MSLIHHNDQDYNEAATEAARVGRMQLETLIEQGRTRGAELVQEVQGTVIDDAVARGSALRFEPTETDVRVKVGDRKLTLGRFALSQVLQDARLEKKTYDRFIDAGDWGRELAAHNLNTIFHHDPSQHRIRSVEGKMKGFLSMSYQPRDVPMLLDSFFRACKAVGALPFDGRVNESRFYFRVILPKVFEPVKNEVVAFFLNFGESEFGNGATCLSAGIMRLACTNQAVFENVLRKVHLGGNKAEGIEWSQSTIRKMTEATAAQLHDGVAQQFAPAAVHKVLDAVTKADKEKIDPWKIDQYLKKHTTKAEVEAITEIFRGADVVNLPAGQSRYRMSNAISFFAQQVENGERAEELQRLAGAALVGGRISDN